MSRWPPRRCRRACMLRRPTPMPACCTAATSKPAPSSVMRSISQCGSGHCSCTCTHWARLCLITLASASSSTRVSARHCSAPGGCGQAAGTCQSDCMSSASNRLAKRWRSGAIHAWGVSGTVTETLVPLSIIWRRSSRSSLSTDRNWRLCMGVPACSSMAMERTREPPRLSCRSCASCIRSCSREWLSASACSRASVPPSSSQARATLSVSSWLNCSMRRMPVHAYPHAVGARMQGGFGQQPKARHVPAARQGLDQVPVAPQQVAVHEDLAGHDHGVQGQRHGICGGGGRSGRGVSAAALPVDAVPDGAAVAGPAVQPVVGQGHVVPVAYRAGDGRRSLACGLGGLDGQDLRQAGLGQGAGTAQEDRQAQCQAPHRAEPPAPPAHGRQPSNPRTRAVLTARVREDTASLR